MKTILFLDNTYPQPYEVSTLKEQAIGGTESSLIKTALILSKVYKVIVAQKSRNEEFVESGNLKFIPKGLMFSLSPDYIVVLRKFPLLKILKRNFPKARLFLWLHTYKNTEYVFKRIGLAKTETTIVCNSKTHKESINHLVNFSLLGKVFSFFSKTIPIKYCYNPVSKIKELNAKRDMNKLLFFSSPNKGLGQVIKCFNLINKQLPDVKLYIANPGYKNDLHPEENPNIIILGSLPHGQMMQHVNEALCIFYPQDSFAETFGLIYAEANAFGTPVLAHDIGSAREVLSSNNKLVDVNDFQQVLGLIKAWQKDFPDITYNEDFSNDNILKQWIEILV